MLCDSCLLGSATTTAYAATPTSTLETSTRSLATNRSSTATSTAALEGELVGAQSALLNLDLKTINSVGIVIDSVLKARYGLEVDESAILYQNLVMLSRSLGVT